VTILLDLRSGVSGDMLLGALLDMYSKKNDPEHLLGIISECASVMSPTTVSMERVDRSTGPAVRLLVDWEPMDDAEMTGSSMMEHLEKALSVISANDRVARMAGRVLRTILSAEMVVHNRRTPEEVHLHETGTPDTLVDVLGCSLLFDILELDGEWVYGTPISLGMGWVEIEHGRMEVPVPAVRNMIRSLPARTGPVEGELATPTGVALVSAMVEIWMDHGEMGDTERVKGKLLGCGAGSREYREFTNVLSIWET